MYCPECGTNAGDAKFCPECGTDLAGFKAGLGDKPAGKPTTSTVAKAKGGGGGGPAKTQPPARKRGISPELLWGVVALVAVAVVVIVVVVTSLNHNGNANANASTGGGNQSAQPVAADTSGDYATLVTRANGLYDQGAKQMTNGIPTLQSSQYFGAAAKVYQAAWAKKPGDPNVGTDMSIAIFYSGDVEGALKQVNVVLKSNPRFQPGLYNKGIFLAHKSRLTQDKTQSAAFIDQARQIFTQAVAVDPTSAVGKQADAALKGLPTPSPSKS